MNKHTNKKGTIKEMREIAKSRNGKCLSIKYINRLTKLTWQCDKKHIWTSTPAVVIKDGCWCPICATKIKSERMKEHAHDISIMQQAAAKRGGKCLADTYTTGRLKIKWACAQEHTWEATGQSILKGSWCPFCAQEDNVSEAKCHFIFEKLTGYTWQRQHRELLDNNQSLDFYCDALKIAAEYQGEQHFRDVYGDIQAIKKRDKRKLRRLKELVSLNKINNFIYIYYYENKDDSGLIDSIKQKLIKNNIPVVKSHINILDFYKAYSPLQKRLKFWRGFAEKRGSKCLSVVYKHSKEKLEWQCSCGQIWRAIPHNIKNGHWCPKCANRLRITHEEIEHTVKEKRGKIIDGYVKNGSSRLKIECSCGTFWSVSAQSLRRGSWCPKCARKIVGRKISMIIKSHGGYWGKNLSRAMQ